MMGVSKLSAKVFFKVNYSFKVHEMHLYQASCEYVYVHSVNAILILSQFHISVQSKSDLYSAATCAYLHSEHIYKQ